MLKNDIEIIFKRGFTWDFEQLPEKSIALDGAVRGPVIDNQKNKYSFDHHENCVRHSTNATCVQVLDALLLGFQPTNYNIYINDIDADTISSVCLLAYPEFSKIEPLQDFIRNLGIVDAHGPAYPLVKSFQKKLAGFIEYVMESFDKIKQQFTEEESEAFIYRAITNFKTWVENDLTETNNSQKERFYEIKPHTKNDWIMVTSGDYVFDLLYEQGYNKIVFWKEAVNNSYAYTIGKKSEFVDFPVRKIIEHLNTIESGWGGGSTIGGAPRHQDGSRSKIVPEQLVEIINSILADTEKSRINPDE